jgi:23S rRNA (cytosine1962-C5)-methyltransferase
MTEAASLPRVFLNAGGDRRLRQGHPWVYANEIRMDRQAKALPPGSLAQLQRVDGKPLAVGTFNPHALIAFRVFERDGGIDGPWLEARLRRALELRRRLVSEPFYRLAHAEADGLPGLVVDRYGEASAVQIGTAGMEALLPGIVEALDAVLAPKAVVLRNDSPIRALEGLASYVRVAKGEVAGPLELEEGGLRFLADPLQGQKTGWYFDQRENRAWVAPLCRGARVLDLFCYGGGFAVRAAHAGASSVLGIDSSAKALELARRSAARNGVADRVVFEAADAFQAMQALARNGERFDVVIADPPSFVKSKKELAQGLKGYRKLARLAAGLTAPGGFLFIASCSHPVGWTEFQAEVAAGLDRAGRRGRIVRAAGAAPDHPVHPALPESAYLKTLLLNLD